MGVGSSALKEELAAKTQQLDQAKRDARALADDKLALQSAVRAQEEAVSKLQEELSSAAQQSAEQLGAKDEELSAAVKQKEVAEALRRSDALLAKRIMTAQLRRSGGDVLTELPQVSAVVEGSSMAAQLALAANDEVQMRQARAIDRASARRVEDSARAHL